MAADIARAHGMESSYHPHLGTISETLDAFTKLWIAAPLDFAQIPPT